MFDAGYARRLPRCVEGRWNRFPRAVSSSSALWWPVVTRPHRADQSKDNLELFMPLCGHLTATPIVALMLY